MAKANTPKKFPSAIDTLLRIFQLKDKHIKVISPAPTPPTFVPAFKLNVEGTRKVSMEQEKSDNSRIKIYTDGSSLGGKVGAAVVLYEGEAKAPKTVLRARLGSNKKHTTFEAEAVGGVLATWILASCHIRTNDTISIYTDNQVLIQASRKPGAKPGQYLLQDFVNRLSRIVGTISLRWISGHTNVKGNEMADQEAKRAAEEGSSTREDLPPLLQQRLPISATAEKRAYHEELKTMWLNDWDNSPRKAKFDNIDPAFPFHRFHKLQDSLNRPQASILTQLRTSHIPLNRYLHRFAKRDSPKCTHCPRMDETVNHYLFQCSKYRRQRQEMMNKLGVMTSSDLNLRLLTSNPKAIRILLQYVSHTGRFSNYNGDVLLSNLQVEDDNNDGDNE
ncbi:unnamed protein product [Cyclocybe aegerita]|uniref:ribonuclease H n=1 Tax=Cyclocybe aegerita TaxID=1973307 RepID=A0A8S0WT38_CYCAE|nr:unnamed protein product [Cyclocybe aegerita]